MSLIPRVLADDEHVLVVEESHFGRVSLCLSGLFLAGLFVAPAILSGSVAGLIIGLVLGAVVVGPPFLIVLAISKYRRLEVWQGTELVSVTMYQFRSPRTVRVTWDEISRVVCERRRVSSPKPGRMLLTLHMADGSKRRLLAGCYSEDLKAILHQHFADKFGAVETFAPFYR